MKRAYTVAEIDQMRRSIEFQWLYGFRQSEWNGDCINSRICVPSEKEIAVEQQLRTYMLAGISPAELE